jgi:hypothetical protein
MTVTDQPAARARVRVVNHQRTLPWWDVVLIAAAVTAVASIALPAGPLRAVVVVPIVVLLPGWAALHAVFGTKVPTDRVVDGVYVTTFGIGAAIADGLVVNALGIRLSPLSLVTAPFVISLALFAIALARGAQPSLPVPDAPATRKVASRGAMIGACVAFVVAIVAITGNGLPSPASTPYVETAFAGSFARLDHPLSVQPGASVNFPLKAQVHGMRAPMYRVSTYVDDRLVQRADAGFTASRWTGTTRVVVPSGRCLHRVRIVFSPLDEAAPTTSLDAYLAVSAGRPC